MQTHFFSQTISATNILSLSCIITFFLTLCHTLYIIQTQSHFFSDTKIFSWTKFLSDRKTLSLSQPHKFSFFRHKKISLRHTHKPSPCTPRLLLLSESIYRENHDKIKFVYILGYDNKSKRYENSRGTYCI